MRFKGKTILITGGATGIGRATALAFAREGGSVMIGDVNDRAEETVALIAAEGGTAHYQRCDVALNDDVERLTEACIARFGRLDVGFNNAGIFPEVKPLDEVDPAAFARIYAVNVMGVFHAMRAQIRHFRKSGGGVIVNTGSIGSVIADPGMPAYVSSKHAVLGLTRAAALENARNNIRVNAVGPGMIDTPMTSQWLGNPEIAEQITSHHVMGRAGRPEEIAALVLFLASDAASYVNGQIYIADGGMTAH